MAPDATDRRYAAPSRNFASIGGRRGTTLPPAEIPAEKLPANPPAVELLADAAIEDRSY
jgi:hypothetical protein